MNMKNVTIVGEDGNSQTASLIAYLKNGNDYGLFYTMNEPGSSDQTVKIYYAKEKQNNPMLDTPLSDEEWDRANSHMRSVIKGDASTAEYLAPKDSYSIIGFKATNMPISYDYINKQVSLYYSSNTQEGTTNPEAPAAPDAPVVMPQVPEEPVASQVPEAPVPPEVEADKPVPPVVPEAPVEASISPDINIPSVNDINAEPAPVDAVAPIAPEVPAEPAEVAPAPDALAPTMEAAPEAPAVPEEPAPAIAEPPADVPNIFETPAPMETPASDTVEPLPVNTDNSFESPAPITPNETPDNNEANAGNSIEFIKEKYNQMREFIDQLEQMEIDAVNRIEDTMKLNDMANAQHAEAVAQDMGMSNDAPVMPETPVEPAPVAAENPTPEAPAAPDALIPEAAPIEPVTPVVPEATATDSGETNWFDTPQAA